jgi:hypothetical protein
MSGTQTRSILKKRRTHHNKTIRFKPDDELELVRQISDKEGHDKSNWRTKRDYTMKKELKK